ncbi:MAG: GvpL/GvpF family gas vesicle protein [bacterium]|nr:GvpL/GvpF family gas vesicle protein [bacterium]
MENAEARYLYCIASSTEKVNFGSIGIDGSEVYTIVCQDLCAVVHNCSPAPYQSEDNEVVKKWAMTHQKVIDTAWEKFGTVLPLGFDTVIKGEEGITPDENIKSWVKKDYENLKEKIAKFKDKAEYAIQISWDARVIGGKLTESNPEIKKLNEEIESKSKGLAYMYKQKLENLLKKQMEAEAEKYFKDFYERIKKCVDEIKVEKVKKTEEGKQMLVNFSCLLFKEKSKVLGDELEKVNNMEGFFVRFTGPWPPYSFV